MTYLNEGHRFFDIDSGLGAGLNALPTQHFTIIFNTFVMMTLFNEINSRKIHGERNIFEGLFSNPIFYGILIVTAVAQVSDLSSSFQFSNDNSTRSIHQVIIVQFGGRPFSTASLTLEQWAWCVFFGLGVLVWGQLITTIPTKRIPKQFTWGSGPPEEIIDATSSLVENGSSGSLSQDVKRTGQILWIRGLTRLQTQVCLIQLHNSTVSQQLSLKRASLGSPTSPTSLAAMAGAATTVATALSSTVLDSEHLIRSNSLVESNTDKIINSIDDDSGVLLFNSSNSNFKAENSDEIIRSSSKISSSTKAINKNDTMITDQSQQHNKQSIILNEKLSSSNRNNEISEDLQSAKQLLTNSNQRSLANDSDSSVSSLTISSRLARSKQSSLLGRAQSLDTESNTHSFILHEQSKQSNRMKFSTKLTPNTISESSNAESSMIVSKNDPLSSFSDGSDSRQQPKKAQPSSSTTITTALSPILEHKTDTSET